MKTGGFILTVTEILIFDNRQKMNIWAGEHMNDETVLGWTVEGISTLHVKRQVIKLQPDGGTR